MGIERSSTFPASVHDTRLLHAILSEPAMLRFEADVRINANATPAEIASRLEPLVAQPRSLARPERRKPLRGRVSATGGVLRWPLNQYRFTSPRNLRFELAPANGGTVLRGKFTLWQPLRLVVLAWLTYALAVRSWTLIRDLAHRAPASMLRNDLLFIAVPICMASGYLWVAVHVGKGRDADLIRVLRVVLASETGSTVVAELLTRPASRESFGDPPIP